MSLATCCCRCSSMRRWPRRRGYFSIEDVAANLNAKLIRRHPHIFADAHAATAEDVTRTWNAIKQQEKGERQGAHLDGVPRHVPSMMEAAKLGSRAAQVGFDWPDAQALCDKLDEETAEVRAEIATGGRVEEELGDLLFTAVNLARHLAVEPEFALRAANAQVPPAVRHDGSGSRRRRGA